VIPLVDLAAQHRAIKGEVASAIARVLDSGQFVLGDEVAAFEEEFAAFCDARYAVALNTGTSALHVALLAAGVGPGDEVITAHGGPAGLRRRPARHLHPGRGWPGGGHHTSDPSHYPGASVRTAC
jgi:hypothetical protein